MHTFSLASRFSRSFFMQFMYDIQIYKSLLFFRNVNVISGHLVSTECLLYMFLCQGRWWVSFNSDVWTRSWWYPWIREVQLYGEVYWLAEYSVSDIFFYCNKKERKVLKSIYYHIFNANIIRELFFFMCNLSYLGHLIPALAAIVDTENFRIQFVAIWYITNYIVQIFYRNCTCDIQSDWRFSGGFFLCSL